MAKETTFRIRLCCGSSLFARELARREGGECGSQVITVVAIHGGPGLSDQTEILAGLRRLVEDDDDGGAVGAIVFYDQLGCGESDGPERPELYSLRRYVDELREVITVVSGRLGCDVCLLGHSWGGQIALELLLGDDVPPAVRCAVISNAPLNEATYEARQRELRSGLDEATRGFYEREEEERASDGSVRSLIYRRLIGLRETKITGEMAGWSALDRLGELPRPCLFVSGDDDTIPHEEYRLVAEMQSKGVDHRVLILKGGSHGPFYGSTAETYFSAIRRFLRDQLGQGT